MESEKRSGRLCNRISTISECKHSKNLTTTAIEDPYRPEVMSLNLAPYPYRPQVMPLNFEPYPFRFWKSPMKEASA